MRAGIRPLALLLAAALAAALVSGTTAQRGPPKAHPRLADIPYIQCQVCELLAKNAWKQVKEMMKAASPSNKVDEMKIIEKMEKITTAWRPEGEWIAKLDLVEEGDTLAVKEMDQVGNCGIECKTVERAAEQIVGEHDTDIAETLFTGRKTRAQFNNWLCYELSGVCRAKPPPLPKDREPGPPFSPQREDDQNLERMMGQMQDSGMRGQLWSREELMEKYGIPEGDQKWDDDEDDVAGGSVPSVPPPVAPTAQHGASAGAGAADLLAAARQSVGEGLRAAAAQARGLLAAAGKVRHVWQDTKWARDLWRALRTRQQQPGAAAVEQEL
ncbi:hypothetical protein ABPG75_013757 [Micractinium tetrahymenae]